MKIIKVLVVLCFSFLCGSVIRAEGLYFGVGLGNGDVDIEREFFPMITNENTDSNNVLVSDLLVGYEYSNGVFLDIGIESYDTVTFIFQVENTDLNTTRLGIGYTLPSESRFTVYGKTGINFWQLELTESGLFNPGPEASGKRSGEDAFFQIGTEYHFNETFRLGLSYDYSTNDFGETTGGKLTFKWFP